MISILCVLSRYPRARVSFAPPIHRGARFFRAFTLRARGQLTEKFIDAHETLIALATLLLSRLKRESVYLRRLPSKRMGLRDGGGGGVPPPFPPCFVAFKRVCPVCGAPFTTTIISANNGYLLSLLNYLSRAVSPRQNRNRSSFDSPCT